MLKKLLVLSVLSCVIFSFPSKALAQTISNFLNSSFNHLESAIIAEFLNDNFQVNYSLIKPVLIAEKNNQPSPKVIEAIKQDLAKRFDIPLNQIKVKDTIRQTWSDGCLGLAKPDEFCTQALVEGWKIIVSNQQQTWVYRTDNSGSNVRLVTQ